MVVTGASSTSDVAVVGSPAPLKTRGRNAISENALGCGAASPRSLLHRRSGPRSPWTISGICQEALYIGRPHAAARVT